MMRWAWTFPRASSSAGSPWCLSALRLSILHTLPFWGPHQFTGTHSHFLIGLLICSLLSFQSRLRSGSLKDLFPPRIWTHRGITAEGTGRWMPPFLLMEEVASPWGAVSAQTKPQRDADSPSGLHPWPAGALRSGCQQGQPRGRRSGSSPVAHFAAGPCPTSPGWPGVGERIMPSASRTAQIWSDSSHRATLPPLRENPNLPVWNDTDPRIRGPVATSLPLLLTHQPSPHHPCQVCELLWVPELLHPVPISSSLNSLLTHPASTLNFVFMSAEPSLAFLPLPAQNPPCPSKILERLSVDGYHATDCLSHGCVSPLLLQVDCSF